MLQVLLDSTPLIHPWGTLFGQSLPDAVVIAQFKDTLGGDFSSAWNNFVQSGQIWALMIGFFVGYILRSFTSF